MTNTTGICVQIGLHKDAEFIHCVYPEEFSKIPSTYLGYTEYKSLKEIPEVINNKYDKWKFYGVDCDPFSITHMMSKYPPSEDIQWILAFIYKSKKRLAQIRSWFEGKRVCSVPIVSFDELIESLKISKIDVLAMDIESLEFALIETYSWRIKPAFITIEVHINAIKQSGQDRDINRIISVVEKQGYTIYKNIEMRTGYRELQLILSEQQ